MTDGIGRIIGGGNSYIGGFGAKKQEEAKEPEVKDVVKDYSETQVDASRIMDLLAANSKVVVGNVNKIGDVQLGQDVKSRVEAAMEEFVGFVGAAAEELGDDDLALLLADVKSERWV